MSENNNKANLNNRVEPTDGLNFGGQSVDAPKGSDIHNNHDKTILVNEQVNGIAPRLRKFVSNGVDLLKRTGRVFLEVFIKIFGNKRFIRTMLLIGFLALLVLGVEESVSPGLEYRDIVIESKHLYFVDLKDFSFIDYEFADTLTDEYRLDQQLDLKERSFVDILWLDLSGGITDYCAGFGAEDFITSSAGICAPWIEQFMDWLYAQPSLDIKGLLITLNSPGGELTASDRLFRAIKKVSQKVKVYIYVPDYIASGGVYVAVAADKVFVSSSALVGNIGVIAEFLDYTDLLSKIGVKRITYVSSKAKYKTLKGLLDNDRDDLEDKYFQAALDAAEARFHRRLLEGRGHLDIDKVANGLLFSAKDAVELNLVDNIAENEYEVLQQLLKDVDLDGKKYVLVTKVEVGPQVSLLAPVFGAVSRVWSLLQGHLPINAGLHFRILLQ